MNPENNPAGRQSRGRLFVGIGLGAVLGLILALTWSALGERRHAGPAVATSAPGGDVALGPAAARAPRAAVPTPAAPEPQSSWSAASQADEKAATLRLQARHEAAWSRDRLDPQGAAALEQHMAEVMDNPRIRADLRHMPSHYQAHCKASMCRIEATFASRTDDANSWLTRFLIDEGGKDIGNVTTVSLPQPDGSMQLVLYAYRPGHAPATP